MSEVRSHLGLRIARRGTPRCYRFGQALIDWGDAYSFVGAMRQWGLFGLQPEKEKR